MGCIKSIIIILNFLAWTGGIIFAFTEDAWYGIIILFCFLLFLFFYLNANSMLISRLDRFVSSDWEIFKHKLSWANGQAVFVGTILIIIRIIIED